jgi:hypothetical protein
LKLYIIWASYPSVIKVSGKIYHFDIITLMCNTICFKHTCPVGGVLVPCICEC